MKQIVITVLLFFIPITCQCADIICKDAMTTIEMNKCLAETAKTAESVLSKYLDESRKRFNDDQIVIEALNKSQIEWIEYRKAHCNAIYTQWREGTIRGSMFNSCILEQTKQRTYDIWKAYLTYMDSTPPILPNPKD